MFTIENLHSELERGGARVQVIAVVVVECYCFLINIIVVPAEPWRPLFLCNCRHF